MNFILSVFALALISFRFFVLYKVLNWLFINYNNLNPNFSTILWVLIAIFLDLYLCTISKEYNKFDN